MSDEIGRMSAEDKFLGVRTTIEPPADADTGADGEVNVEVVDDRPADDQRDSSEAVADDDGSASDEELAQLGNRAQKRIKKLKWEYHEERRAKEASDRLANEAVNYTQNLQVENQRLLKLIQDSQTALTEQSKNRADASLTIAQENFKRAHESGDSEQITIAQQHLTNAQLSQAYAPAVSQKIIDNWKQQVMADDQQIASQQQQYVPEPIQPDAKAMEWQDRNSWFGTDKEMTSFAYGVHEKLVGDEGIDPESEQYYELIDSRMKEVFPTQFGGNSQRTSSTMVVDTAPPQKKSVVASASRNSGATPRTVRLTDTQVKLAKRLGLTPQQYAAQVMKEMV
jgi:hypothetical protein|tara:strand:- start:909 stop:1925 length:1017 start_codon:yes stop_codon:yes gene_type:complete